MLIPLKLLLLLPDFKKAVPSSFDVLDDLCYSLEPEDSYAVPGNIVLEIIQPFLINEHRFYWFVHFIGTYNLRSLKMIKFNFRLLILLAVLTTMLTMSFTLLPSNTDALQLNNVIASGEVELLDLESYDFVTGEKNRQIGGDLYVRLGSGDCYFHEIWANFPPQQGGLYIFSEFDGDLSTLDPNNMGISEVEYSPFCVELMPGGVYIYKRHAQPADYVIFRVDDISTISVNMSYVVIGGESSENAPSQDIATPDSFTLPAGQHIDSYDGPGGEITGYFQVELFFNILEERDGFLHVAWDASNGASYDAWVKRADVEIFLTGEYDECPFVFTSTDYMPTTFPTPDGSPPKGVFSFDALVDLSSEPVTLEQTEATMQDASDILFNLTGFVIRLNNYGTVELTQEQKSDYLIRDNIPTCYIEQTTDAIPDSLVIFSYGSDNFARTMGGFTYTIEGPPSFKNHFVDPYGNDNLIYVMFNHHSHMYARCGYDEAGENIISDVSVGGECTNQPGTPCVMKNGYSMCSNSVDALYASTPNYFSASTVIHEIMHSFGLHGNLDHYGAPECKIEMGWDDSWVFDDEEAEKYNVMCPYVYDNFVAGYRP